MPKKPMKWGEQKGVKRVDDPLKINEVGVIHLVRDEGVAGSNPATPTICPIGFPDRNSACLHRESVILALRTPVRDRASLT
jgi:hypothetical protein